MDLADQSTLPDGDQDVVQQADLNAKDLDQMTLLHYAAAVGSVDILKQLVKRSTVDVDSRDSFGRTPLHAAVVRGHEDVVLYLVEEAGADLFATTNEGRTALHLAARYDQSQMIYLLLHLVSTNR